MKVSKGKATIEYERLNIQASCILSNEYLLVSNVLICCVIHDSLWPYCEKSMRSTMMSFQFLIVCIHIDYNFLNMED